MSESQETFAIKEFRSKRDNESQKEYLKRITAEFTIGSCLFHENIIKTIDLIQDQNVWFMVLEYAPGGDMLNLLLNQSITLSETCSYFSQLIAGVCYLHQMGVAHKDLKPENCIC